VIMSRQTTSIFMRFARIFALVVCSINYGAIPSQAAPTLAMPGTLSPFPRPIEITPGMITIPALSFAIVGDTRPPSADDVSAYPTAIITRIWQDIEAASPRPLFAVTTGNYMFAEPNHTPGTQNTQLSMYLSARASFSNVVYPAMGSHEYNGETSGNCDLTQPVGSATGPNANYTAFLQKMLLPVGKSLPYYTLEFAGPHGAWTAKFVFIACNAWSATQATWLNSVLSQSTTYTFIVRNVPTNVTTSPCLSGSGTNNADTIISQHPYTLLIVGHTHTFAYYASSKEVIVGNGGVVATAPVVVDADLAERPCGS